MTVKKEEAAWISDIKIGTGNWPGICNITGTAQNRPVFSTFRSNPAMEHMHQLVTTNILTK